MTLVARRNSCCVEETLFGLIAPSVGQATSWDVLNSIAGSVCSTETAASHGRTTPVLRGSCQQGPERRDPLVSGATSRGQELQNLLCSHSTWLFSSDVCPAFFPFRCMLMLALCLDTFFHCSLFFTINIFILNSIFWFYSLTEPTIWWTLVETLTDGARRYKRCGERFIKGTKTLAYRSRVPPVATLL